MSIVSDIYDAWIDLIESTLTSYSRIYNPLDTNDAPSIIRDKGYAFIPTTGENTTRNISCSSSYQRSFEILLVNQITAVQSNVSSWDSLIKSIHEDVHTLFKAIEKSDILNDVTIGLGKSKVLSDSGLEYDGSQEKSKFFQISIQVETEFFESI